MMASLLNHQMRIVSILLVGLVAIICVANAVPSGNTTHEPIVERSFIVRYLFLAHHDRMNVVVINNNNRCMYITS